MKNKCNDCFYQAFVYEDGIKKMGCRRRGACPHDREVENLWAELEDVPFDENECGELVLAEAWRCFPAGTDREEIWHWFDEEHSRGVAYLLGFSDKTNI